MITVRRRRLYFVLLIIVSVTAAVVLALVALGQNVDLYLTPNQVASEHVPAGQTFRLGGLVLKGSVKRQKETLEVEFVLTNKGQKIKVKYNGILPSLFHDGQGIVTQGRLNSKGIFIADQVLAKHDATYRPPGVSQK